MVTRLFVRNLPAGSEEESVRELFAEYGAVADVRVLRVSGCAFVEFSSASAADAAMASLDGVEMGGHHLHIEARIRDDGTAGVGGVFQAYIPRRTIGSWLPCSWGLWLQRTRLAWSSRCTPSLRYWVDTTRR